MTAAAAAARGDRIAQARAALARAELRTGARSVVRTRPQADVVPGSVGSSVPAEGAAVDTLGTAVPEAGLLDASYEDRSSLVVPAASDRVRMGALPAGTGSGTRVPPATGRSGPVAVPDLTGRASPRREPSPRAGRPARPVGPADGALLTSGGLRGPVLLTDRPPLAVPPALATLLPDGLRRGSTTAVLGSTSLVLAMIAAACTAREAWAAVVGQPSLGLLAAAQTGVALERLAVVPRPAAEGPTVVAALLDGIDVVVVGPGCTLTDADRRRLMARARDRGSVLLSTVPWAGAGCVLTVEGGRWSGVGEGDGRLRAHELHLIRTGRGSAGGQVQELRVVLPLDGATDPYGLPATGAPGQGSQPETVAIRAEVTSRNTVRTGNAAQATPQNTAEDGARSMTSDTAGDETSLGVPGLDARPTGLDALPTGLDASTPVVDEAAQVPLRLVG